MNLLKSICKKITQNGPLTFYEFMQEALYDPHFGYYSAGLQKFGAQGDFITAPELTPLFGYTLANQCQQLLSTQEKPVIFEFGAGTGQLCVDLLTRLEQLQCLPETYYILELSANLQQRQQALLKEKIPGLFARVCWLNSWPATPFSGIVIANEVLDAMPIHRFLQTAEGLYENYVDLNAQGELSECFKPCQNPRLLQHVQTLLSAEQYPYQSEANLFIDDWLQQCYDMLSHGAVLIIDYGFPRHEYYHPDRKHGTLICHYRQQIQSNPLLHVGEQDISAHVDFTHVAEAAHAAGFHIAGYSNQASFLLSNGLLSFLAEFTGSERQRLKEQQAVKLLLQPSEMGELFKVIMLTKELNLSLNGFQLQDKRASL